jgi:hypothetical protein
MTTIPFTIPAYPKPISLQQARVDLPPEEFRTRLRSHLLKSPGLTLAQVARELKVSRQCVSQLVGKLNRPDCASPLFMRLAPKQEAARAQMAELKRRVAAGEAAESVARSLGFSLAAATRIGFRALAHRPVHGSEAMWDRGCRCWRCRRGAGVVETRVRRVK